MNKISSRNLILVDIDHCISDSFSRDNLIGGEWDDYHRGLEHDTPCEDICRFINLLNFTKGLHIVGITSRPEKWRSATMKWLLKHNVYLDRLIMRPNDNYMLSHEMKLYMIEQSIGQYWTQQIICLIDDDQEICEAFNRVGVTTLQCRVRR